MTPNNNLSILPFYSSLSKLNHRKDYAFGEVFPLITPDRMILPFQFSRPHVADVNFAIAIDKLDGSFHQEVTTYLKDGGMQIKQFPSLGYDLIINPGALPIPVDIPEGQYVCHYVDWNGPNINNDLYSEVFTMVRNVDDYLSIEYKDVDDLYYTDGHLDFSSGFAFKIYLPTQVGRPDYEFDEQVDKRDGYQFIEKQISEKTYKFNFVAPEFLLDALRVVRMMDVVTIKSKGETYKVDQFLMTPKWQDGGYLAAVEVEFQCDTIIKKIGRGYTNPTAGDFNNDYNNDFDK
jgi:hypothetical protein